MAETTKHLKTTDRPIAHPAQPYVIYCRRMNPVSAYEWRQQRFSNKREAEREFKRLRAMGGDQLVELWDERRIG